MLWYMQYAEVGLRCELSNHARLVSLASLFSPSSLSWHHWLYKFQLTTIRRLPFLCLAHAYNKFYSFAPGKWMREPYKVLFSCNMAWNLSTEQELLPVWPLLTIHRRYYDTRVSHWQSSYFVSCNDRIKSTARLNNVESHTTISHPPKKILNLYLQVATETVEKLTNDSLVMDTQRHGGGTPSPDIFEDTPTTPEHTYLHTLQVKKSKNSSRGRQRDYP